MEGPSEKDISNLTASISALNKQMEKNNAIALTGKETTQEIINNIIETNDSLDKSEGTLKSIAKSMQGVLEDTIHVGKVLGSIGTAAFAANLVKDMVDLDNEMTKLSVRMGKGTKGIKGLKSDVHSLQAEFGTSYENAKKFVGELARSKYTDNIREAAAGIDLMSRASGVSSAEVLELTDNLSKMAGMSAKSTNAMYASMLKVQQSVGISEKGMTSLVGTIQEMASNMSAFGKSDEDIKRMVTQTTSLVGALENVGISAQRSTQFIEQLTDPDRIEDNIMLYSQLGISMEDAMSGNFDLSQIDGQLKDMADRIVAMGPVAGSQFARTMNMSFKEAQKLSGLEARAAGDVAEEAMTTEEQALDTMKQLEAATEGIGTKVETFLNKVEGKLKQLPELLLAGISVVAPIIMNHLKVGKDNIQASVEDGVSDGLLGGIKKAKDKALSQLGTLFGNVKDSVAEAEPERTGVSSEIDKLYAKAQIKPGLGERIHDANNKNAIDTLSAGIEGSSTINEDILKKMGDLGVGTSVNGSGGLEITSAGSDKQMKNAQKMAAIYNKNLNAQKHLNDLKLKAEGYTEEDIKRNKKLSEQLKYIDKLTSDKNKAEEDINQKTKERVKLQERINDLQKKINSGDFTGGSLKELENQLKSAKDTTEDLNKEIEKAQATKSKSEADIARKTKGRSEADYRKGIETQMQKKSGKEGGFGARMAASFQTKTKMGQDYAAARGEGRNGVAAVAGGLAKRGGKAALGGILSGLKGITKMLGPMALLAPIISKVMEKIQPQMDKMLGTITNVLAPIMEAFMGVAPVIMDAIKKVLFQIATKALPPMLSMLAAIFDLMHFILSHTLIPLLRAMEGIPIIGPALAGVGNALDTALGPDTTKAMRDAATNLAEMKESSFETAENTDPEKKEEGPEVLQAEGGKFVSNGTTSENSVVGDTNAKSEAEETKKMVKEDKQEKRDVSKSENLENIQNNTSFLRSIDQGIKALLDMFKNMGNTFSFNEEPDTIFATDK